jgi:hypothetical protein
MAGRSSRASAELGEVARDVARAATPPCMPLPARTAPGPPGCSRS